MSTGLRQKYIEDRIFDVDEGFIDKLQESFSMAQSMAIAKLINKKLYNINPNKSTTYGGVIHEPKATFFSVDCVRLDKNLYSFTDVREIDSDEYLDLINLNLNLNES
jgi:hypothetical protein